jgi:hypothetical protein
MPKRKEKGQKKENKKESRCNQRKVRPTQELFDFMV